jgi:hypothetical protein
LSCASDVERRVRPARARGLKLPWRNAVQGLKCRDPAADRRVSGFNVLRAVVPRRELLSGLDYEEQWNVDGSWGACPGKWRQRFGPVFCSDAGGFDLRDWWRRSCGGV